VILRFACLPVLKHIKDNSNSFPNKEEYAYIYMHGHFMLAYDFTVFKCVVPILSVRKFKAGAPG